jgi:hypothetical protein
MDRKPTEQVATIGINIGKNRFHLIGLEVRLGSGSDYRHRHPERPHLEVQLTKTQKSRHWILNVGSRG